ncbi:DUF4337 domain-containing protein [Pseudoduganella sp. UC29_106]|uniref:DUF4337 domain-containing protein n=1 Tax=Pseudoduganella sp. UC29_106 TaxID=3374553 RepID=UPI0037562F53
MDEKDDNNPLNMRVAVVVALLATFMGICKVKDDNINQAMQQTQANKVDHWSFYQARNIREEVANATIIQLKLAKAGRPASEQSAYDDAIASYGKLAADQKRKKDELRLQAEQDDKTYDALNFKDDQFDLSDAMLAIAIALLAITTLTRQHWLFWVSLVPTAFGVFMGLSGLCGWPFHPSTLVALLS